ncbi:tetratricopeptide repeat protein [candidate division KSB1 bacterium]|nr:tetratricopeptide repeat protein [candidate division KSB1 bacterium]
MESSGLNSEVLAGGKKFHIQTNYLEPVEKIVSTIFEEGKVVFKKEVQFRKKDTSDSVPEQVGAVHKEMISEIELLYYIAEKVKTIRHASSNNKLGLVFLQKNLYDEAKSEFKRAIELDSDSIESYKNLGLVHYETGELEEAERILKAGIEKHDDYPDIHNALGRVYSKQLKFNPALEEFEKALELNKNYVEVHYNIVLALLRSIISQSDEEKHPDVQQLKDRALDHLQKAEKFIDSETLIESYEYFDEDDIENTLKVLEKIEDVYTLESINSFENEFYLKFMFGGKGKDDKFISEHITRLKDAIKKYPYYADLRNYLGIAYLIQCRNLFLNALDEFRQALKINPNYKKAQKNLKLAENDGKGFLILLRAILK